MENRAISGIPCPCPGTPHPDGDTVELRPKLGLAAGIEAQRSIREATEAGAESNGAIIGALVESYIRGGVCAWTFQDERGPVPVTRENIQRWILDDFALALPIAEAADELYEDAVVGPLVAEAASLSPTTPTEPSISPPEIGSVKSPTPFSPSSTSIIPTAAIETTSPSPDGDSRSSQIEPMDQLLEAG